MSDSWTSAEALDILNQCYMVQNATNELIERAENRLAQLDFESKVDKPFLALVRNNDEKAD